jgi:alpha-ribazole phosphatase
MDLFLIRHSAPLVEGGVCYGRLDLPLAEPCARSFDNVIAKLEAIEAGPPQFVWSSPLQRCERMARALALRFEAPLATDSRWIELDFGAWEGKTWSEIDRDASNGWATDYWNVAPPLGETYRELWHRVEEALSTLTEESAQRVAVVSHAGPIRAAVAKARDQRNQKLPDLVLPYGVVVWLRWQQMAWALEAIFR